MNATSTDGIERLVPHPARHAELHTLEDGGTEVVLARARRLRLSPDAAWLLEQLDGRTAFPTIADRLSRRYDREVAPAEAAQLVQRTLVAHGLARLTGESARHARRLKRRRLRTLATAGFVARLAPRGALLAHPAVLGAGAAAGALVSAAALIRADAHAWRTPAGWLLAPLAAAGSLVAHEWMHAFALARAGGVPGAITARLGLMRLGLRIELPRVAGLRRSARIAIDLAGIAGQFAIAGVLGALALATGRPEPLPAVALTLVSALASLLPLPGSDGRWVLDDLAGRDPGDTVRRSVPPGRWFARGIERLRLRGTILLGRTAEGDLAPLLPVFVSASFPRWTPAQRRRHAEDHIVERELARLDLLELPRGGRADEIRHVRPVRTLRAEGRGAVVCALHFGPFHYVASALAELGCPVMTYAATGPQKEFAEGWGRAAQHQGAAFEVLTPRSPRDALRAVRGVQSGRMLLVFVDGQHAANRDQHRAPFRFMGNEVHMRTGAALLARRAGAPIVLALAHREGAARRVVEFSDPLPPPADDSHEAAVERTREMYAWFETRVARRMAQWSGWVWPMLHWRETGGAPTATAAGLAAARARAAAALAGEPRDARLLADSTRVQWVKWNGEHLIVHGPERRVLVASELACQVLEAAFSRERAAALPRRTGAGPEALTLEIARLELAGLARLDS